MVLTSALALAHRSSTGPSLDRVKQTEWNEFPIFFHIEKKITDLVYKFVWNIE